jgi:hypothetical protein
MKGFNNMFAGKLSIRSFLLLMVEYCVVFSLSAQTLHVRITGKNEQPVPNATVFIRETTHGIMADDRGEFQTKMGVGDYTFDISSLGYEPKTMKVSIPQEGLTLNIQLTEKIFTLPEVTVTPNKEDPALRIMRYVIARAPYHLHQVKSYESNIYFKGTFIVEKIPALILSQINEPELKNSIGKLLVYESQNEVKFSAPNNYEQRVIALSTTVPKFLNITDRVPINVITMNIYDPKSYGGLLGPGSFAVYTFKMEDAFYEGEHTIYKIRIIPRKKNPQLVNGYLHIVEDIWTVQQASLEVSDFASSVQFNLNYHEIKPGAFLPTASDINMQLSLMGIKAGGRFYASVKYNQLETNDNGTIAKNDTTTIDRQATAVQKPPNPQQQKNLQKIEELAAKDNLTNREAYRMAQLVEKSLETPEMRAEKRKLERNSVDSTVVVTRDTLALLRDSSFWNTARIQPLREEELKSYLQFDSLRLINDSLKSADSLKNRTLEKWMSHLLMGEKVNFGEKYYIKYDGLLGALADYNFVDGYRIGQRIEAGVNFDPNRSLSIAPAVYYTTARKQADYAIDGSLTYAPLRIGKLSVSAGNTLSDFAGANVAGRIVNELSSFITGRNIIKFYQKRFAVVSNEIDIANGLRLTTRFNYEKRNDLENATSYNLLKREPASNRPHGQTEIMPDHDAYIADIELAYTPRHYYTISKGQKRYLNSSFPTVRLRYMKGFPMGNTVNPSFDRIETFIVQNIRLGLFDRLLYAVNAGTFLSAKQTYLPDFRHFQTNEIVFTENALYTSFTMENYRYATNDKWLQAHVSYTSQYLFLKHIPFLQRSLLEEAVHLKTLWTPVLNHNEVGYSIGLGDIGQIGISVSFRRLKYENVGITISLPLLNLMGK